MNSNPEPAFISRTQLPFASCSTQLSFTYRIPEVAHIHPRSFGPDSKKITYKIRYARRGGCQGAPHPQSPGLPVLPRQIRSFSRPLQRPYGSSIPSLSLLISSCLTTLSAPGDLRQTPALHTGKREQSRFMQNPYLDLLCLIPVGLAVAFMVWAFWNFCKASGKR